MISQRQSEDDQLADNSEEDAQEANTSLPSVSIGERRNLRFADDIDLYEYQRQQVSNLAAYHELLLSTVKHRKVS